MNNRKPSFKPTILDQHNLFAWGVATAIFNFCCSSKNYYLFLEERVEETRDRLLEQQHIHNGESGRRV